MRDPRDYCPRCDRRFGIVEEYCSGCGLDPVNNAEDETFYKNAISTYDKEKLDAKSC